MYIPWLVVYVVTESWFRRSIVESMKAAILADSDVLCVGYQLTGVVHSDSVNRVQSAVHRTTVITHPQYSVLLHDVHVKKNKNVSIS